LPGRIATISGVTKPPTAAAANNSANGNISSAVVLVTNHRSAFKVGIMIDMILKQMVERATSIANDGTLSLDQIDGIIDEIFPDQTEYTMLDPTGDFNPTTIMHEFMTRCKELGITIMK
jgi:hypothetical protein